jgi:PKD repeat protein
LIVENEEGDRDMITQNILVYEKRSVVITTSSEKDDNGEISGVMPFEVTFDSEKSEIPRAVEWKWDFENDGIYDSLEQKVDHIFEKSGEYEVKLTIVDANDQEFSTIQKVLVADEAASASIIADPSDGDVPLTVEFDGSGSRTSVGKIIDYIWEFEGERPIHYGGKISREFRAVGVFPVRLTILTSEGEKASKEIFISVRGQALQAAFEASPLAGDAPLEVRFNSQKSTGNIKEYHWDFGDGKNSYLSNPKHIYSIPGDYIVKLRVIDSRNIISEAERVISVTKAVGGGE